MEWPDTYRVLKKRSWIILCFLTALSIFLRNAALTTGVILGGLVTIINFDVLQRYILRSFASGETVKVKKVWVVGKFYLRFLALGAVLYALIRFDWVDPVGLAAGLSTVVFSIISFGIHNACKSVSREAM